MSILWIKVTDEPVPTFGMNGKSFLLNLRYLDYFGHNPSAKYSVVTAIWDSINECFYESESMKEIDSREIVEWWKNPKDKR